MKKYKKTIIAIADENMSGGCLVYITGYKLKYFGKLSKPWSWFSFKRIPVVKSTFDDNIEVNFI